MQLTQSTFRGFVATPERYTSAVGFSLKNTWQLTPRNNLTRLRFHPSVSGSGHPPPPPHPSFGHIPAFVILYLLRNVPDSERFWFWLNRNIYEM